MKGTYPIPSAYQADLEAFNDWVLACQEEAFTLAVSLLGDEGLACEVVRTVFLRVYAQRGDNSDPIPVQVMRGVMERCRRVKPSIASAGMELVPGWHHLDCEEQEALLLVDVLGKSYPLTALVLNKSEPEVAVTVARGRHKLIR